MAGPGVVSRNEWLKARKALLAEEKALTRRRDELAAAVRKLPAVAIEKQYLFEGPAGQVRLGDLFGPHRQLIVYHFMFDPEWQEGCKSCSHFADNVGGTLPHLAARDTALAMVSRAPYPKIAAFQRRMGWTFPWYSSANSDFNYDFHVTLDESRGSTEYNFSSVAELMRAGKLWTDKGEWPALSVFLKDGSRILHTYSTFQRGLDIFMNTYNLLDVTPLGRHEDKSAPQSWVRHHDRYA